jgi:hypothetical protein
MTPRPRLRHALRVPIRAQARPSVLRSGHALQRLMLRGGGLRACSQHACAMTVCTVVRGENEEMVENSDIGTHAYKYKHVPGR